MMKTQHSCGPQKVAKVAGYSFVKTDSQHVHHLQHGMLNSPESA